MYYTGIGGWTNFSLEITTALLEEDKDAFELKMKNAGVKIGGRYEPDECQTSHKVAIIVPVRDRRNHLTIFLRYMHPFLQRQQRNYTIVIVEQSGKTKT